MPPLRTALVLTVVLGVACSSGRGPEATPSSGPPPVEVTVGTSRLVESRVLATTLAELLDVAGFAAIVDVRDTDRTVRQALELGDVDLAPGYTGRAWLEVLERPEPSGDPRTSFARVREFDLTNGIVWLPPRFDLDAGADGPPADATFGLFVRGVPSLDADVQSVPSLAQRLGERPDADVCVDQQFADRPDGWASVARAYAIGTRTLRAATPEEALRGVAVGECLVGLAAATDGRAWSAGLQLLSEPLDVFPSFVVTAQVRQELLDAHPEVADALAPFADHLTTRLLGGANAAVATGAGIADVADDLTVELLRRAGRAVPPELEGDPPGV